MLINGNKGNNLHKIIHRTGILTVFRDSQSPQFLEKAKREPNYLWVGDFSRAAGISLYGKPLDMTPFRTEKCVDVMIASIVHRFWRASVGVEINNTPTEHHFDEDLSGVTIAIGQDHTVSIECTSKELFDAAATYDATLQSNQPKGVDPEVERLKREVHRGTARIVEFTGVVAHNIQMTAQEMEILFGVTTADLAPNAVSNDNAIDHEGAYVLRKANSNGFSDSGFADTVFDHHSI